MLWIIMGISKVVFFRKKNEINRFMLNNFSEAKGNYFGSKKEYNYQLFLNKYMNKGSDGNYTRKAEMWNENKNGTFSPIKPSKK